MKRLSNLLAALVFASLVIFMSCGGGGSDPAPSVEELAAEDLVGKTWTVDATTITFNSEVPQGDWDNFTLSFSGDATGGTYETDGVPDGFADVWPASGNWSFVLNGAGTSVESILRDGEVSMSSFISEASLTLTFTVDDPSGARTNGLYDFPWTFEFGL